MRKKELERRRRVAGDRESGGGREGEAGGTAALGIGHLGAGRRRLERNFRWFFLSGVQWNHPHPPRNTQEKYGWDSVGSQLPK